MSAVGRFNDMETGAPAGEDTLRLDNAPKFKRYRGLILRFTYPVTTGSAFVSATAVLVALMTAAIGALTLRYADGTKTPYVAVRGDELRNVQRFVQRSEVPNGLASLAASTTNGTVTFDLMIPFEVPGCIDGDLRCPGWSQMRTFEVDITEGAALNYNGGSNDTAVRGTGNMLVDVDYEAHDTLDDMWSPILTYWRNNQGSLQVTGPDGVHLGAWDINAAYGNGSSVGGSSNTNLVSMSVGDHDIYKPIPVYILEDEYQANYVYEGGDGADLGDISDTYTVLLSPREGQSTNALPCGPITIAQANQYVSSLEIRGLYWPVVSFAEAKMATVAAAKNHGQAVLATNHHAALSMPDAHSRTAPVLLHPVSKPDSYLNAGLMALPQSEDAVFSVPLHIIKQVGAVVSATHATGAATGVAGATVALKTLAKSIPGAMQAGIGASPTQPSTSPLSYLNGLRGSGISNATSFESSLRAEIGKIL